jgi:hypothetical protein
MTASRIGLGDLELWAVHRGEGPDVLLIAGLSDHGQDDSTSTGLHEDGRLDDLGEERLKNPAEGDAAAAMTRRQIGYHFRGRKARQM